MKRAIWILTIVILLTGFQNCSQSGFQSKPMALTNDLLKVNPTAEQTGSSPLVVVNADLSRFAGLDSVTWDNSFGQDLTYCQQTTSADETSTTFLCPSSGWLTVYLTVSVGGVNHTYTKNIYVDVNSSTGTDPDAPPDDTPLTGAQLYAQYCSGCHGPIGSSTKLGISLSDLNNALNSISEMSGLSTELTDQDKQSIVSALDGD